MTSHIDELARKAVEVEKFYKDLPTGASFDATPLSEALGSFHDAATPSAWLDLSARLEKAREEVAELKDKLMVSEILRETDTVDFKDIKEAFENANARIAELEAELDEVTGMLKSSPDL